MMRAKSKLIENLEDIIRLEVKTDPEAVKEQARWCGVKSGLQVLDAGCGPGKVTSILYEMIRPAGSILGVDYVEERIHHAKEHYGRNPDISFQVIDLRDPLDTKGQFDLIWVRFVLEYNRSESFDIIKNLTAILKPGGFLCLLDLDHNSLNYYELPSRIGDVLFEAMKIAEESFDFDPYSGRKLYSYLYDFGYENIQVELKAHHLIYGEIAENDLFNWTKKSEIASSKIRSLYENYAGGRDAFVTEFTRFLMDPRRFIYTPLILCKGMKPLSKT